MTLSFSRAMVRTLSVSLALAVFTALTAPVHAQSAATPFPKLFGAQLKKPKEAPPPAPLREDTHRILEILVELAWLGDRQTFPFYIEARVEGANLVVRGNVPSPAVRERAVKLAQLNCPIPVVDMLKENPQLAFRPLYLPPEQLQRIAVSGLREALPKQAKGLQARCSMDGRVAVSGHVESFEDKLTVSRTIRRLHGCNMVTNLVAVASDPDGSLAKGLLHSLPASPPLTPVPEPQPSTVVAKAPPQDVPIPTAPPSTSVSGSSPVGQVQLPTVTNANEDDVRKMAADYLAQKNARTRLFGTTTEKNPPPAAAEKPGESPSPKGTPPSLTQLKKRLEAACPGAREIKLAYAATGELVVEVYARSATGNEHLAEQVLAVSDLVDHYRFDLRINIPAPDGKSP